MGSASVVGFDNVSGPHWVGKYGRSGYLTKSNTGSSSVSLPSYFSSFPINRADLSTVPPELTGQPIVSASLYLPDDSTQTSFGWYSGSGLGLKLNPADSLPHLISVYAFDTTALRSYNVQVWDYANTTQISSMTTPTAFANGVWIRIAFQGQVAVKFQSTNANNVYFSGILFDDFPAKCGLGGVGNYLF